MCEELLRCSMLRCVWLSAMLTAAHGATELTCQIFDETMVCDNERGRLDRAEIRTCSG